MLQLSIISDYEIYCHGMTSIVNTNTYQMIMPKNYEEDLNKENLYYQIYYFH